MKNPMHNFARVLSLLMLAVPLLAVSVHAGETDSPAGTVAYQLYKDPNCGCCDIWVDHMAANGFAAQIHHPGAADLNAIKVKHGIAPRLQSCHTAVFEGGYFFEGHIPARYVSQFLSEKPQGAKGLTVPGMPLGSPGMEMGDRFTPYQVLMIMEDGSHQVYADIASPDQQ